MFTIGGAFLVGLITLPLKVEAKGPSARQTDSERDF
jgi:hypothetical protein